jgi:YbbR domain-containing protein
VLLRRIGTNFTLKVLSLGLALLLSVFVVMYVDPPVTKNIDLPIRAKGLGDSVIVIEPNPLPQVTQIRVTGPLSKVNQLLKTGKVATIDFTGIAEPGRYPLAIELPDLDLQVISQELTRVDTVIEEKATKTLPIQINRRGAVDENFAIVKERLAQDSVKVTGPKPQIERVQTAQVEPDVEGIQEAASNQSLEVLLFDINDFPVRWQTLNINPDKVRYSLELEPIGSIKVLTVYPDYTGQLPQDFVLDELIPRPLRIAVDADLVPEGEFAVRTSPIDLGEARGNFVAQDAKLIYPFEVPEGSRLPETCEVMVRIVSLAELAGAARVAVELLGQEASYDYIVTPREVVVRSEELTQMAEEDVARLRAKLDVSGLVPGEYRLVPQLALPLTLVRVRIDPDSLLVTIIQRGD